MALGKNIEHLRNLRGMSRGTVARGIGLDDDQPIYALEKRDSKRSNLAPALAKLFAVSLESLLEDDLTSLTAAEIGAGAVAAPRVISTETGSSLDNLSIAFGALSDSGKAELLQFAEFLLTKEKAER
ncbi:hypothetical protein [Cupriavidus metallidurans]|jgi:DNA-binding XRE family transcriptional regulator|uniref:Uncharacterized protein n=1 Tax=Cupriavidus metallidurans TaxID=119219 RepID=A0A482INN5_9BURK|nr:hypothetical protein [Cupriavidus metallidurans]QBP10448.1 hypothetical protein DDF84_012150 [Cupriavidus metallidurans]QWC87525.1 hypothetical protein KB891_10705 [Cupriavidus metallidurans]